MTHIEEIKRFAIANGFKTDWQGHVQIEAGNGVTYSIDLWNIQSKDFVGVIARAMYDNGHTRGVEDTRRKLREHLGIK